MTETLSLRVKIEQSPMGAYQWMIVVMAAIMNLLDGFDVLALAFTATAIRGEFGLTGIELGYLLSAGLFGMTAGSLFLAPLADKIGRRPLLLMAVSLSAIGMLGSAFYFTISMARFLARYHRAWCRRYFSGHERESPVNILLVNGAVLRSVSMLLVLVLGRY